MTADDLDQALCAQVDLESHFPDPGGSSARAKALCHSCDIEAKCLAWALLRDDYGVFGGRSQTERRAAKRVSA